MKSSLSIREAIALKRAEAAKAKAAQNRNAADPEQLSRQSENALDLNGGDAGDDLLDLGRFSVAETIERARSTGSQSTSAFI